MSSVSPEKTPRRGSLLGMLRPKKTKELGKSKLSLSTEPPSSPKTPDSPNHISKMILQPSDESLSSARPFFRSASGQDSDSPDEDESLRCCVADSSTSSPNGLRRDPSAEQTTDCSISSHYSSSQRNTSTALSSGDTSGDSSSSESDATIDRDNKIQSHSHRADKNREIEPRPSSATLARTSSSNLMAAGRESLERSLHRSNSSGPPDAAIGNLQRVYTALVGNQPSDVPLAEISLDYWIECAERNIARDLIAQDYLDAIKPFVCNPPAQTNLVLRPTAASRFWLGDIEGITFEKLLYHSLSCDPASSSLKRLSASGCAGLSLAQLLDRFTLCDVLFLSFAQYQPPEVLFMYFPLLARVPECKEGLFELVGLWMEFFSESLSGLLPAVLKFLESNGKDPSTFLMTAGKRGGSMKIDRPSLDGGTPSYRVWEKLSTAEMAELITAADSELFCQVSLEHLFLWPSLSREERATHAPTIAAFIEQFEHWHNAAATYILAYPDAKDRSKALTRVIKVALLCKKLNNISALMALQSSIQDCPVARLKHTWASVPAKFVRSFTDLAQFISSDHNHAHLRRHCLRSPLPGIPHLGLLLQDFASICKQPQYLSLESQQTDLLSFEKLLLLAKESFSLLYFQSTDFRFTGPITGDRLRQVKTQVVMRSRALLARSLHLEPRA